MSGLGGDLRQRNQDKLSQVHRRVRNIEPFGMMLPVIVEKKIQVDRPRAFGLRSMSTNGVFYLQQCGNEGVGIERRTKFDCRIQEPRLICHFHRRSFIQRRNSLYLPDLAESADRFFDIRGAITDVGAERDVCGVIHACCLPATNRANIMSVALVMRGRNAVSASLSSNEKHYILWMSFYSGGELLRIVSRTNARNAHEWRVSCRGPVENPHKIR